MHLSESRSEPKTPANMPSLRQLEFAFQTVAASLWDASRFAERSGYSAMLVFHARAGSVHRDEQNGDRGASEGSIADERRVRGVYRK